MRNNNIIPINLEETVTNLSTKLNHFFTNEDRTGCTFYGTNDMSSAEIRRQITDLAMVLSDQGFFCEYTGGDTIDVFLAPPDTANVPTVKKEPTFALLTRIFSMFEISATTTGCIFLINKNGLSTSKMREVVAELESRKLNAEYYKGNNFITVSTSEELESFFTSLGTTKEDKNISVSGNDEKAVLG